MMMCEGRALFTFQASQTSADGSPRTGKVSSKYSTQSTSSSLVTGCPVAPWKMML